MKQQGAKQTLKCIYQLTVQLLSHKLCTWLTQASSSHTRENGYSLRVLLKAWNRITSETTISFAMCSLYHGVGSAKHCTKSLNNRGHVRYTVRLSQRRLRKIPSFGKCLNVSEEPHTSVFTVLSHRKATDYSQANNLLGSLNGMD